MSAARSIITRLVLLVTVLITAASFWLVSQQDLAATVDHRHPELFEQLASTDVAATTDEERLQLMRRLDRAFRLGVDWQQPLLELDEPLWRQFRENLFTLLHEWLVDRANTYHDIGQRGHPRHRQERRERFVDKQTAIATAWIAAAADAEPAPNRSPQQRSFQIGVELFSRFQRWSAEAEGEQQARIMAFTRAMLE